MEQLPKLNKWAASITIINLRIVPVLSTCLCLEILLYILIIHNDFCDGLCALYKISQNHQLFISSIILHFHHFLNQEILMINDTKMLEEKGTSFASIILKSQIVFHFCLSHCYGKQLGILSHLVLWVKSSLSISAPKLSS